MFNLLVAEWSVLWLKGDSIWNIKKGSALVDCKRLFRTRYLCMKSAQQKRIGTDSNHPAISSIKIYYLTLNGPMSIVSELITRHASSFPPRST